MDELSLVVMQLTVRLAVSIVERFTRMVVIIVLVLLFVEFIKQDSIATECGQQGLYLQHIPGFDAKLDLDHCL